MSRLRRLRAMMAGLAALACVATAGPAIAGPPAPPPPPKPTFSIVVKVDVADGYRIGEVTSAYPVSVQSTVLASRGIYLVGPTDPQVSTDPGKVDDLAHKIATLPGVTYAERDVSVELADTQFHSWPYGRPAGSSTYAAWLNQPVGAALGLSAIHRLTTGSGVVVAVLDTGAAPYQAAWKGRLVPGWNYVDDNANTAEVSPGLDYDGDGRVDSATGHGTFVAGLIALVAPGAKIMPMRVLNSDGYGSVFVVAQAILDAVADGADVINLSFGTATDVHSQLLTDALNTARQHGVVVVAAAGNDGDNQPHYPASTPGVVGVGALDAADQLTSFSDFGPWVAVAAPGLNLVGPLPAGKFAQWSGTSMAAPIVAGQAALLRALVPTLTGDKLAGVIENSSKPIPKAQLGHGMIQLSASLTLAQHTH